jgi:Domain of unknown function (DUF3885)
MGTISFFLNISKKIIYHLYDDRGCDVIAADREHIRLLYEVRNEWILDYDRDKIDSTFSYVGLLASKLNSQAR